MTLVQPHGDAVGRGAQGQRGGRERGAGAGVAVQEAAHGQDGIHQPLRCGTGLLRADGVGVLDGSGGLRGVVDAYREGGQAIVQRFEADRQIGRRCRRIVRSRDRRRQDRQGLPHVGRHGVDGLGLVRHRRGHDPDRIQHARRPRGLRLDAEDPVADRPQAVGEALVFRRRLGGVLAPVGDRHRIADTGLDDTEMVVDLRQAREDAGGGGLRRLGHAVDRPGQACQGLTRFAGAGLDEGRLGRQRLADIGDRVQRLGRMRDPAFDGGQPMAEPVQGVAKRREGQSGLVRGQARTGHGHRLVDTRRDRLQGRFDRGASRREIGHRGRNRPALLCRTDRVELQGG